MPWPMVHIAISNILYANKPTPNLLLGSIAPDAIHVRGEITREEKGATHLVQNGKLPPESFIMKNFKQYLQLRSDIEWRDFVVGYFTHIYTDLRWTDTLYADYEQSYSGDNIRATYNQEVSQLEFELQRMIKNTSQLIDTLKLAEGCTINPFVTQQEVQQYRDLKMQWLQDPRNEPSIQSDYFDLPRVQRFIEMTSKEIETLLKDHRILYDQEV